MSSATMYRAAVIGLGFVGAGDQVSGDALGQRVNDLDGTHSGAYVDHPRVDLVAGASRDEGRRARFTQRESLTNTYADWRQMLDTEALDIVSVAAYSPLHAEMTIHCAERGVRCVLCEKPIATRLCDADRMIAACQSAGTLLAIAHNRRWRPDVRAAKQAICDGAIGRVCHAYAHWPTGRLGNLGTHVFDAIRLLLGTDPVAVSGRLDPVVPADCRGPNFHDPGGWGVIEFPDRVKVYVDATSDAGVPLAIQVTGTAGRVSLGPRGALLEPWDAEGQVLHAESPATSSLDRAVDEIVGCLDGKGAPSSTGRDGRQALEMIVGFHASDRRDGQRVTLPIRPDDRDLEVRSG